MLPVQPTAFAALLVALCLPTSTSLAVQVEPDADLRAPRFLLAIAGTRKPLDVQRTPALARHISLDLDGETLAEALAVITQRSGLRLAYTEDVLPDDARVRLQASQISVAGALSTVLLDAGVDVVFTSGGQASLVKRAAVAPPPVGSIVGRVTDAKTGQGLEGAQVLLENTKWRTVAGEDGRFRLAEVEAGSYTLLARRIGYGRRTQPVAVETGQEVAVDVALDPVPTKLEELVTTGTVVPTEVKALPSPVTIITAAEIEQQRPQTLTELFRQAVPSGVAFDIPALPYITSLSLRGATSITPGSVKVYLDGIELASPSTAPVDPRTIERIEVISGPQAAAIYGSGAIGGVIQIFTKRGDLGRARPQIEGQAAWGTVESPYPESGALRQEYAASVRGGNTFASYSFGGGYTRNGEWVTEGTASYPSAHGAVRFLQGPFSLDLSGRFFQQNVFNPVFDPAIYQLGFAPFGAPQHGATKAQEQTYGIQLTYSASSWWRHNVTAGVDRFILDIHRTEPLRVTPGDTLLTVSQLNRNKVSIRYSTAVQSPLGRAVSGTLTAGLDHYEVRADGFFTGAALNTEGTIGTPPGQPATVNRDIFTNTGYFTQAQLNIQDAMFLTAGIRAEQNSTFGAGIGTPLLPRFGGSYVRAIGAMTLKLRAAYGDAIQPPAPGQQSASLGAGGSRQLANPALRPQRQKGWDAGADLTFGSTGSLNATYYDQTVRDIIMSVQTEPLASQWQNVGRVGNSGVELAGAVRLGPAELRAQYAYTRSRIKELGASYVGDLQVGDQVLAVPRHTAGASLSVTPLARTTVTAGMTYVGDWTLYDWVAVIGCFGGTRPCRPAFRDYQQVYPGFLKVNFSIAQDISSALTMFASVHNATNRHQFEQDNQRAVQGRMTMVGLHARY